MRLFTMTELLQLTRSELFNLHQQTVSELARLRRGSPERAIAIANLRLLSCAIGRSEFRLSHSEHDPGRSR